MLLPASGLWSSCDTSIFVSWVSTAAIFVPGKVRTKSWSAELVQPHLPKLSGLRRAV